MVGAASSSPYADLERQCAALLAPHVPEGTELQFDRPQDPAFGALSCNVAMRLSRLLRKAPAQIAQDLVAAIDASGSDLVERAEAIKGFINFHASPTTFAQLTIAAVLVHGPSFGVPPGVQRRRVLIEHTSVNPNKPWHIGHVRNAVLGDVLGRVFRFVGHEVEIQNYIDDTGKQVADMLFGLEYLGLLGPDGTVDVPPDRKLDHFFGDAYVRINRMVEDGELRKEAFEAGSARYAHAREAGEYRDLVRAIVLAQLATAWRLGIFYDILSWEGDVVQGGLFDEALQKLLATNAAYHQAEGRHAGCVVIEMGDFLPEGAGETADDHPTERVLIRSNGLPTYTAKDIAYHMWKYRLLSRDLFYTLDTVQPNGEEMWTTVPDGEPKARQAPDEGIVLIDARQALAQKVVKAALQVAGYSREAAYHHHLGYGVVSPRGGSFSGRKGTEYSADAVLDAVVTAQYERSLLKAQERNIEVPEQELRANSEMGAVASLRYLMCRSDPLKDITFTIEDVIDEHGTTAVYIQYAYARMQSIFAKGGYEAQMHGDVTPWDAADLALLIQPQEQALIRVVARLPFAVAQAVDALRIHTLADYGHELAESFNLFYGACQILRSDVPPELKLARLALAAAVAQTIRNVAALLGLGLPDRL